MVILAPATLGFQYSVTTETASKKLTATGAGGALPKHTKSLEHKTVSELKGHAAATTPGDNWVSEGEDDDVMTIAREYMMDTGLLRKSSQSSQEKTTTTGTTIATMHEVKALQDEQTRLMQTLPEELEEHLPPELKDMVKREIGDAKRTLAEKEVGIQAVATATEHSKVAKIVEGARNQEETMATATSDQFTITKVEEEARKAEEIIVTAETAEGLLNRDMENLLKLVDEMPEATAKSIYLHVVSLMQKQKEEDQKREELIQLQLEQMKLFPQVPEELLQTYPKTCKKLCRKISSKTCPNLQDEQHQKSTSS